MKTAIVTGPTGAVGLALIARLIKENIKVYAVCRPGSARAGRVPVSPLVEMIFCDASELGTLPEQIKEKCDVFYHFAWEGTTGAGRNDMFLQSQNIRNTLYAVEAARALGCKTFIGAGSQAEYGRVEGKLSAQTPVNPENGYGMAKLCAGQMSRVKCRQYNIKHIWTRILSVYGPYDGEKTMIMSAIRSLSAGEIPEFTKGEQVWDYLYSGDAANILFLLAERGIDGKIYCLGSGHPQKLADYIRTLRDCVAPDGEVALGKIPYADKQVMYLCADTTDVEHDLGYHCQYTFEDGIRETWRWMKEETDNAEN